jgi:hypothetical protein
MDVPCYWPNAEEQAVIAAFIREYGHEGYGLCFRLGAYRAQGLSLAEAEQRLRKEMACSGYGSC